VDWVAEPAGTVEGLDVPMCVEVDPSGQAFVSNIETRTRGYWKNDGTGFISLLAPGGKLEKARWRNSSPAAILSGPKGLCILNGSLYVAESDHLVRYPLKGDGKPEIIEVDGAQRLVDLTNGKTVYASDSGKSLIYRVAGRQVTQISAPTRVASIVYHNGTIVAATSDQRELYDVDPTGRAPTKAFGLSERFVDLGGVDVLSDGSLIVADYGGNKIYTISPDRQTVKAILELKSPGIIGVDRKRNLLFVPLLNADKVAVFQLAPAKAR
jgi:outer membrane protein assembly factor BamB